ncbi:MAG: MFS transporter [Firmicutes bacterium]|nr:MFS transporter [Bacillota bacterium]
MDEINNKTLAVKGFRNIFLLGLVSFFTDLSTEMVAPLVTIYLSTFATVAIIGIIEGITESITAILKSYSGYIGDKFSNKKILAIFGYSSTVVYKIMLFFSFGWVGVLFAKLIDRIGKGIRTAPRDALLAESSNGQFGKAFGFHKMMDMLGSAFGILFSIVIIYLLLGSNVTLLSTADFKTIFLLSIIPALAGLFALIFVKETKHRKNELKKFSLKGIHLEKGLIFYLLVIFIFSIGNSSNAFLVLRVKEIGFSTLDVLWMYLIYNVVSSIVSYPLGKLSDLIPRRKLVIPGYILYAFVYFGIALTQSKIWLYVLFGIYGIFQAIIAGSEKAYITEISPKDLKGTVLGLYGTAQGLGLFLASFLGGWLWVKVSPESTFYFGGLVGLLAAIALAFVFKIKRSSLE